MNTNSPFNQYKWWVIFNPVAGNGLASRKKAAIERLLHQNGFDYQLVETSRGDQGLELVSKGIKAGYRHIMAVGGDGTNNDVINGILQQQLLPPADIVYTLIPVGTGNDWIKTHRIPGHFRRWIPRIAKGKTILHNVGWLRFHRDQQPQERYFINVAGFAYDAFVVREKGSSPGVIFPKLYYLWMVFICLFKYTLRQATVHFNDQTVNDRFYTINIGICKYSGGGMQLVPHADPTSDQMALTIAGPVRKADILLYTPKIFAGTLHTHPKVAIYHTEQVRITAAENQPTLVEADGEFLGETPVECRIIKNALRVLIPGEG